MKLQYFGTAAAEGWPALFCGCEACRRARAAGGRNIRTRSQAMIDDKLLIDFPADTYLHMLQYGLDLNQVDSVIITHAHEDHFYPEDFGNRREGFAHVPENSPRLLTVYGSEAVGRGMAPVLTTTPGKVAFEELKIGEAYLIDGYSVTALPANHDPSSGPVIYLIGDGKSNLLYAHDTGYFPEETWKYLESFRCRLSGVSLDCTGGLGAQYRDGHMGTQACCEVKKRLFEIGIANEHTVFCLHHFSHNGKSTYDEIKGPAAEMGFDVSYDGMILYC